MTRSQVRDSPTLALRTTTASAPARRRRQPPSSSAAHTAPTLVTYNLQAWTFWVADLNNLKLTQLVRYGALFVGDELRCYVATYRRRLRITYIAQGGHIYFQRLDYTGITDSCFVQNDGTPYFTAPDQIMQALGNNVRDARTGLTSWNALEVFRGGIGLGTLNEIREDFRVRGSQRRPPPKRERIAVATPTVATPTVATPAPTTGAEDTTETAGDSATSVEDAEEAVEDEMDVEPYNQGSLYEDEDEDEDAEDDAAAATG